MISKDYTLGIDIGSTTVKIALLDNTNNIVFSDYKRHFANIQETLADLLKEAQAECGNITLHPVITGSGGLTLAKHLEVPFVQEVVAVSTSLKAIAPKTDVAIELGGEDAKIIYFEDGNVEQRMNGICAGGTGSFIDQMASLLQTDAAGLNESLFLAVLRQLDLEREQFCKDMSDFSEGQKKKVLIAASLITPAHLYIWDEPLNYIDVFSRMQIEKLILQYKPTMLLVEHDVRFREKVGTGELTW